MMKIPASTRGITEDAQKANASDLEATSLLRILACGRWGPFKSWRGYEYSTKRKSGVRSEFELLKLPVMIF